MDVNATLVDFHWDIQALDGADAKNVRYVEGYCTTDDIDLEDERVTKEAQEKIVNSLPGQPILLNHQPAENIGVIEAAKNDENGIYIKGLISKTEDKVWTKIQERILSKMSIRLRNKKYRIVSDNGRRVNEITDFQAPEVSITSLPANKGAALMVAYSKALRGGVDVGKIDVDNILKAVENTVRDLVKTDQDDKAVEEKRLGVIQSLETYIKGVADHTTLTDDVLTEKIKEASNSISSEIELDPKDVLDEVKKFVKVNGDSDARIAALEEAMTALAERLTSIEDKLGETMASVTKSILEEVGKAVDTLESEVKELKTSVGSAGSSEDVKSLKETLEGTNTTMGEINDRIKAIEDLTSGRQSGGTGGDDDDSPKPSFWRGAFPV